MPCSRSSRSARRAAPSKLWVATCHRSRRSAGQGGPVRRGDRRGAGRRPRAGGGDRVAPPTPACCRGAVEIDASALSGVGTGRAVADAIATTPRPWILRCWCSGELRVRRRIRGGGGPRHRRAHRDRSDRPLSGPRPRATAPGTPDPPGGLPGSPPSRLAWGSRSCRRSRSAGQSCLRPSCSPWAAGGANVPGGLLPTITLALAAGSDQSAGVERW
jgi:hypothetical protein